MRSLLLAASLLFAGSVSAQKTIKIEEAAAHVGDSVQFCDKVVSFRYAVQEAGKPVYFYFGKAYPNQQLTMIVWFKDRKNFKEHNVELAYGDAELCVRGKVELRDGKPVVIVSSDAQIGMKDDDN